MSELTHQTRAHRLPRIGDAGGCANTGRTQGRALPEVSAALDALRATLRPLTRVLLRSGVSFGTFNEIAKQIFVEAAHHEFPVPGRRPSIAHTSVLTGLTRKEVSRRLARSLPAEDSSQCNGAARVVRGWVNDPRFADAEDGPRALAFESGSPSFVELVRAFGGDMPARCVLDELLRVGAVRRRLDGRIKLLHCAYVPGSHVANELGILRSDVADLIACIEQDLGAQIGPRSSSATSDTTA